MHMFAYDPKWDIVQIATFTAWSLIEIRIPCSCSSAFPHETDPYANGAKHEEMHDVLKDAKSKPSPSTNTAPSSICKQALREPWRRS